MNPYLWKPTPQEATASAQRTLSIAQHFHVSADLHLSPSPYAQFTLPDWQ